MPTPDRRHPATNPGRRPARPSAATPMGPALVSWRPRRIHIQGQDVDTGLCIQRYCPYRGTYVIQTRHGQTILESPWPLPFLDTRGAHPNLALPCLRGV
jgi:hypothetical protein